MAEWDCDGGAHDAREGHDEGTQMREQLESRLAELQREFAAGEQQLRDIEAQQARLRDTLLRIDGAMHVLREMLAKQEGAGDLRREQPANHALPASPGNGRGAAIPAE
jgi:predicted nuclease with TOPRIM domain